MGLSNEISFILIFLAVPVQQVKMFWSKLAVRRYLSSSVTQIGPKTTQIFFWKYLKNDGRYGRSKFGILDGAADLQVEIWPKIFC